MAINPQKPKGAAGLPQASAKPPADKAGAKPPAEVFVLDRSKKSLQHVPFSKIVVQEKDYAFREGIGSDPFSKTALRSLKESIMRHGGIHTPILLRDLGNGTYLLVDGHGRYFALLQLIEEKVAGFTPDMLLPANVLATETSDLVMVATGISANTERRPLAYEGRLKATKTLYELGMPRKAITQLLNVSESTVDRDLALAGDDEMMAYVKSHYIQATYAASLLAAAAKHNRRNDLVTHFKVWLEATKAQIAAEIAALKAQDADMALPASQTWPQSRLTAGLVKHWRTALEKGNSLADPGFRFKAMVRSDGGVQRIEVDALNKPVDDMSAEDVAKVLQRCVDLAANLEPVLTSKMAEENEGADQDETSETVSPGQQRLQQLGWGQLAGQPDDDLQYDPADYEPSEDPIDPGFDPEYGP